MSKVPLSSILWPLRLAGVATLALAVAGLSLPASAGYFQINLVSDIPGLAARTDPNLVNPWGLVSSGTSPFWAADNGMGVSTLYNPNGSPNPLVVTVPTASGGSPPSTPTGVVFNGVATEFLVSGPSGPAAARFMFATQDGTISGWPGSGTVAIRAVDNSASGAIYVGLAIGSSAAGNMLYAANFHSGAIDVFNSTFGPGSLAGSFTDPTLPAGYAPFNIQNVGGILYAMYAPKNPVTEDEVAGPGNGLVDKFDTNGNFLGRVATAGVLNAPWGIALAPANFGEFSNDLLVGNFGDGTINAFDPAVGTFLGTLADGSGNPIVIDGLWGLRFGNGVSGGNTNKLYFVAGINDEANGLFGSLQVPEPASIALLGLGLAGLGFSRRRT